VVQRVLPGALVLCAFFGLAVACAGEPEGDAAERGLAPTPARGRAADGGAASERDAEGAGEDARTSTSDGAAVLACPRCIGCADGTREGFFSADEFPAIAACDGAWSIGGVLAPATKVPACDRAAGNTGKNAAGVGCTVADLCEAGWHVCTSAAEVAMKSGGSCAGAVVAGAGSFFLTRQSGPGAAECGTGSNDLFGCGDVGASPDAASCAPIDRFSGNLCSSLPSSWSCGADGVAEADAVAKTAVDGGGVLCCRD
jgi:hypothetical protein